MPTDNRVSQATIEAAVGVTLNPDVRVSQGTIEAAVSVALNAIAHVSQVTIEVAIHPVSVTATFPALTVAL